MSLQRHCETLEGLLNRDVEGDEKLLTSKEFAALNMILLECVKLGYEVDGVTDVDLKVCPTCGSRDTAVTRVYGGGEEVASAFNCQDCEYRIEGNGYAL